MNTNTLYPGRRPRLSVAWAVLLAWGWLAAGGSPINTPGPSPDASLSVTINVPQETTQTVSTLPSPDPSTATPIPWYEPTPEMGLFECHFVANQYHSQFINCWRGLINGVLICIGAGRLGRDSDPAIGILIVTNGMYADPFAEPYRTPLGAGWVRITSVEGTVVHLLAEDNETAFLFDLDSRQWQILTPVPFVAHDYTAADLAGPTVAAWETQVQGEVEGRMTEVARDKSRRTATPMSTPLPPTPTLGIGLISDTLCDVLHFDREPLFTSCWHTQVNNVVVFVAVGYIPEQILGKEYSLPARQRLWVCIEPGCTTTHPNTGLPAPSIDLHITGVRGPLIMLASRDPTAPDQFVFDLILHRWQRMAAQP